MCARRCCLLAISALALVGYRGPVHAGSEEAKGPVIVVAASYPGAGAQEVAEAVAALIENQINGVGGMVGIESRSGNDGTYVARVRFEPSVVPEAAEGLVRDRVSLATPQLPSEVQRGEVSVKVEKAEGAPSEVAIAVIDRQDEGWKALQQAANAVAKRLATEGLITKAQVFPRDEKQVVVDIDRAKCAARGIKPAEVQEAVRRAGPEAKVEELRERVVRGDVSIGDVAAIREVTGPGAAYRVDLQPAIRITGAPPDGMSVAAVTAKCVGVAEAEIKRLGSQGFAVAKVSAK